MASKDLHLVGFRIGRETFGIPIALVYEIVRIPQITSIPEAPDCVEGVINLRGKIIPIIDLRKRFREKVIDADRKNRILVAEVAGNRVGLIVDSASEVLRIPCSEVDAPPCFLEEGELNYITGVGKLNGRLIILIELSKILQHGLLRRLGDLVQAATLQAS
jgi:purine-binding chemotaxis protein CheW